jgi:DNA gyrase inhibitor GyrI
MAVLRKDQVLHRRVIVEVLLHEKRTKMAYNGGWLPSSGREPADFPTLHNFINDPDQTPVDELMTDILLPLMERPA